MALGKASGGPLAVGTAIGGHESLALSQQLHRYQAPCLQALGLHLAVEGAAAAEAARGDSGPQFLGQWMHQPRLVDCVVEGPVPASLALR